MWEAVAPRYVHEKQFTRKAAGYGAAVLGVTLATLFIAAVQSRVHIGNISLVYLPVVLWLAASFGRGPAIAASFLAFLAYDFFLIPPLHRLVVDDPTEWLSLSALLATSLVLGQLTAAVQARARDALESQQRIATLYALAQLIASTTDQDALLDALTRRVLQVFGPCGVQTCGLILHDESGRPVPGSVAPTDGTGVGALRLEDREHAAQAVWVFEHGAPVGGQLATPGQPSENVVFYVPLRSGHKVVGVLGIAGPPAIRMLIGGAAPKIAATAAPLSGEAGDELVGLFTTFCDQIALALDRAELQQQAIRTEALRESDRLKNVLLGSVTHDLRTPLASITAATSSLLEPGVQWSEVERREFLESIDRSADRLNRLVGNLLDLSRLEAGVAQPEKDWYPIGDAIATVLDRLDLTGQTRDRRIVVDVADDVPLVPMDHGQIEQVLTNLLENAIKYSPVDSAIRVQARVMGSPPELETRVSDQGIGIPASELHAIFDKFYRVQHVRLPWASARPPTGTGLGLAICNNIVRAHGGRIWAESTPDQGSTFIFTLPVPTGMPDGELPELEHRDAQPQEQSKDDTA